MATRWGERHRWSAENHEEAARRCLVTADHWDARGDAERAEFERRRACLEWAVASLERDRADLEDLRDNPRPAAP